MSSSESLVIIIDLTLPLCIDTKDAISQFLGPIINFVEIMQTMNPLLNVGMIGCKPYSAEAGSSSSVHWLYKSEDATPKGMPPSLFQRIPFLTSRMNLQTGWISHFLGTIATWIKGEERSTSSLLPGKMSLALSMALCYINRRKRQLLGSGPTASAISDEVGASSGRVLVISTDQFDDPNQYISFMNVLFSAQKGQIPIDLLSIRGAPEKGSVSNNVFLKQVADLTTGYYYSLPMESEVIGTDAFRNRFFNVLTSVFSVSGKEFRSILVPHCQWGNGFLSGDSGDSGANNDLDFRATCVCHDSMVKVAFVCPVCLSVYCESYYRERRNGPVCLRCKSI